MPSHRAIGALLLLSVSLGLQGCASPRQLLLNGMADALAAQGASDEDDLQLARDAAPFHLKLSESLLRQTPGHLALAESVAAGFTQYAWAFVAFEADRIESQDARAAQRLRERAARLYDRARGHALAALDRSLPGLRATLARDAGSLRLDRAQVGLAYWAAAAWAAAISLSKDRPEAVADLPQAVALARAAYAAHPEHGQGALASLMGTLEASRPGGTRTRAQAYFDHALALAADNAAPVHVAMAEALAVPVGDRQAFERWLRQARQAATGRSDLSNRIMLARADWLLASVDDLF